MTFAPTFKSGDSVQSGDLRGTFRRIGGYKVAVIDVAGQSLTVSMETLRHAPVTIVGPRPKTAPHACPVCTSSLTIDTFAIKVERIHGRTVRHQVRAAFCNGCEFVTEF